jgi:hypothetical protein
LARNVYGDETQASSVQAGRLAHYAMAVEAALGHYELDHFLSGQIGYPDPASLNGA